MNSEVLNGFPIQAQAALASTVKKIQQIEIQIEAAEITNDETLGTAGDLDKYIATQLKIGDEKRKEFTEPLDDAKKAVMAVWNPLKNRLEKARRDLRAKMNNYAREAEAERRRLAAEARKAQEEEALRLAEQLAESDAEVADSFLEASAKFIDKKKTAGPTRGNYGSATSIRKRWIGEVVDLPAMLDAIARGALSEELISVNIGKLNDYARTVATSEKGLKDGEEVLVSGVRIFQDVGVGVR